MNKVRVQDADARRTIRDLQKGLLTPKGNQVSMAMCLRFGVPSSSGYASRVNDAGGSTQGTSHGKSPISFALFSLPLRNMSSFLPVGNL